MIALRLTKGRVLKGLICISIIAGLLTVLQDVAFWWLMADNFYEVRGKATITPDAVGLASVPALVCVGKGGPLETSGVYAAPIGAYEEPQTVYVVCRTPAHDIAVPYQTDVISSMRPRRLHAYVWLEKHTELTAACRDMKADSGFLPAELLSEDITQTSRERPCLRPEPNAPIGYAIAFRQRFFGKTEETHDIRVIPNGYRTKNAR